MAPKMASLARGWRHRANAASLHVRGGSAGWVGVIIKRVVLGVVVRTMATAARYNYVHVGKGEYIKGGTATLPVGGSHSITSKL